MKLKILDIIKDTDLRNEDSVCDAYKAVWSAFCTFCSEDSRLVCPDFSREVLQLRIIEDDRYFDNYDICDTDLVLNFVRGVQELLYFCARQGIEVE